MKQLIWIVAGVTGEYSDRSDWSVCAYYSKERAEEHASKAMHRAKELQKAGWESYPEPHPAGSNEYDPKMQMDHYTGTEYTTYPVEIRDLPNSSAEGEGNGR